MPAKRLLKGGNHHNLKNPPKFKHSNIDSIRTFPMHCGGPSSPEIESARASQGFLEMKDMDEIYKAATGIVAAMKANLLRTAGPSEVNSEYSKPNDASNVKSFREKLDLKDEKFNSAMASRRLHEDVLLPKAIDDMSDSKTSHQPLPLASDHQKLKNTNSAIAIREIEFEFDWDALPYDKRNSLSNLKTFPSPPECASECGNPKIQGGIGLFHKSPNSEKSQPLANRISNSETKPFKVKLETNKHIEVYEEDDDCIIVEEKSNRVFQGNLFKDLLVSSAVTQQICNQYVQWQTFGGCEIKEEHVEVDEEDDDCIIVEEKSSKVCQGNLFKDLLVSSAVTQQISKQYVQGQTFGGCEIKEEDDDEEEDDEIASVLCASERKDLLQSAFKGHKKSQIDNRVEISSSSETSWESSVGKIGELSEIYWVEDCTKKSVETKKAHDLTNMNIVPYDAAIDIVSREKVQKARSLYNELFKSLLREHEEELKGKKVSQAQQIYVKAAMVLKKEQRWVNVEPSFGHVPGVHIGDQFQYRAELCLVGVHHELNAGINYVTVGGESYAISVVDSGRYENKAKPPNILVYSGQGGNPKFGSKNIEDQKLEKGNLALKNSMDGKLPVRVIRKTKLATDAIGREMYVYDGIYAVSKILPERSAVGKLAYMFELVRMSDQPDCTALTISKS